MHIVDYELFEVPPRWLFLKLVTSDGTVGWGEPTVEAQVDTVKTAVERLLDDYLLGNDPTKIEDNWQLMHRSDFYRGGLIRMSAIAGIDQALWDIRGKHLGEPVYRLLGGPSREKIRVYQWIGGDRAKDIAREAQNFANAGHTALKIDAMERLESIDTPSAVDKIIDRVSHLRDTVGSEVDICIDFKGGTSKPMAKRLLRELEPYHPMFVEEPLLPEHNHLLSNLEPYATVPIATGERLFTRWDYRPLFEQGAVDVIQPNISHAGGITEVQKIAAMAETYDVTVSPNCPIGPIAFAASLQVDAAIPNFLIQDVGTNIEVIDADDSYGYLADYDVFDFEDGYLDLPSEPGLGIEIDEDRVREQASRKSDWQNPVRRLEDGSVTDW